MEILKQIERIETLLKRVKRLREIICQKDMNPCEILDQAVNEGFDLEEIALVAIEDGGE